MTSHAVESSDPAPGNWFARRRAELASYSSFDLAATMTALYFVGKPPSEWYLQLPLVCLGVAALLWRSLLRSKGFWMLACYVCAARVVIGYWTVDNHIFLLSYWCIALLTALWVSDSEFNLRRNARLLIGFAFFFAMIWKAVLAPDFRDGSFFRATILKDLRFQEVALVVGGLSLEDDRANRRAIQQVRRGELEEAELVQPEALVRTAKIVTWWTLIIEGLVAILFLLPTTWWASRWRDLALLGFVWTTYPIATVLGFGWLLVILGAAQSARGGWVRGAYVLSFFLVLAFSLVPWAAWLTNAVV